MVSVGLLFAFFYIVVVSWSVWYLAASVGLRLEWELKSIASSIPKTTTP